MVSQHKPLFTNDFFIFNHSLFNFLCSIRCFFISLYTHSSLHIKILFSVFFFIVHTFTFHIHIQIQQTLQTQQHREHHHHQTQHSFNKKLEPAAKMCRITTFRTECSHAYEKSQWFKCKVAEQTGKLCEGYEDHEIIIICTTCWRKRHPTSKFKFDDVYDLKKPVPTSKR